MSTLQVINQMLSVSILANPELRSYGCRVLCIRASLFTYPLSVQVPQCLPHLHQPAYKNPTLLKVNMKVSLKIYDLEHRSNDLH